MTVLDDISRTQLEGAVRYVAVTDQCTVCKEDGPTLRYFVDDNQPTELQIGFRTNNRCEVCDEYTDFITIKVVPSRNQND